MSFLFVLPARSPVCQQPPAHPRERAGGRRAGDQRVSRGAGGRDGRDKRVSDGGDRDGDC